MTETITNETSPTMDIDKQEVDAMKPDYEIMPPKDVDEFRGRIIATVENKPDVRIVGGAALRIYLDLLGAPLPKKQGDDIDVIMPGNFKNTHDQLPEAGYIDVMPEEESLEEPSYFTEIEYQGRKVLISTPEHLWARKIRDIEGGIKERGNVMEKDLVYYPILKSMVTEENFQTYIKAVRKDHPFVTDDYIAKRVTKLENDMEYCVNNGLIIDDVHPPKDKKSEHNH